MANAPYEQRNPYRGDPPRPTVLIGLRTPEGEREDVELLADTGCPHPLILARGTMARLRQETAPVRNSNFGLLEGGWLRVMMPEFGLNHDVLAYASDAVANAVRQSYANFHGIVGLDFLRQLEFGGNADSFWIRSPSQ